MCMCEYADPKRWGNMKSSPEYGKNEDFQEGICLQGRLIMEASSYSHLVKYLLTWHPVSQ